MFNPLVEMTSVDEDVQPKILTMKRLLEVIDELPDPVDVPAELHAHPDTFRLLKQNAIWHVTDWSDTSHISKGLRGGLVLVEDPTIEIGICEAWTMAQVMERESLALTTQEYRELKLRIASLQ